ncbi:bacteriohemerythrin [Clostridium thailandense]|uniref:Hemerythrin family protein n=1 Tax=Clostridium thailandense TaxID=2794346 RepID=A0A949TNV0_9CLOT|nr:hemerythrin family protein [Clostridium thailandense]MBV7276279.1 hemerythrin family protein [Clostridium thailandense]MCH5137980.1 hemerythrin family protein [Clostridiaceae bacterium UIB06]
MMQLFSDRLLLNIDKIDNQHKMIFEVIGKFQDACSEGRSIEIIRELIDALKTHTKDNFKQEEEYMTKYNYPEYDKHKESHNIFMRKINLLDNTITGNHISLAKLVEINEFFSEGFVTHISEVDGKLGEFLKDKL